MSKNVNVGLLFRELGINKSEAFRDEVSRAFSANIMPKVEQILDDRGITDRRDKTTFVRRYSQAILDTLDQQLGMIFHEVSQTILPRIVGDTDVADGDIVFSQ